jgi:hypothetical protein
MSQITKSQLRERLECKTDGEIADFFGITLSAVSQWAEHAPIPPLRQLEAEKKRPDLFLAGAA